MKEEQPALSENLGAPHHPTKGTDSDGDSSRGFQRRDAGRLHPWCSSGGARGTSVAEDGRNRANRQLIADVEGNFPELTLEVGWRLHVGDVVAVEWMCNYGDGRLYRNVTIGELDDGEVARVTDYWGEPTVTPEWRQRITGRLDVPVGGIWPAAAQLGHY